jgi:hypothetical protein
MSSVKDMFDVSSIEVNSTTTSSGSGADFFKPSPDNGKQGVYEAVVRFVPYLKDKECSIIKKHETFLTHPNGTRKSVYSYRSIGQSDSCPIVKAWREMNGSKDASINERKKDFEQKEKWWCLVQILQDNNKPETVGKVMIWNFGWTLIKKIQDQMGGSSSGMKSRNPFDVINGRPMRVKVIKKAGYPEYSGCEFKSADDFDIPLYLGEGGQELSNNGEDLKKYGEYLLANSPDITKFKFKEWDDETRTFVEECIQSTLNGTVNSGNIKSSMTINDDDDDYTPPKKTTTPKKDKGADDLIKGATVSKKKEVDDFDIDDDMDDIDYDFDIEDD